MSQRRKSTINPLVIELTMTALFATLIILMTFTPIGYIPIGPVKMTLLTLPVAIGSIVLGKRSGLILGTLFGLTSFYTCFGLDAFGNILLGINPIFTFIMCVIPRVLCGFLPALIYQGISKKGTKNTLVAIPVAAASTAIINTLLFITAMWALFNNNLTELLGTNNLFTMFATIAGVNGLIEIAVNIVVGTAICKPLIEIKKRLV
ncbi:MAG: ECF transporter S component [Ruminococcaceae bacterium]|nr:ECF transporter S component [Oscillospiraceae bacterium]